MKFKINLGEVSDTPFEIIDSGNYVGRLVSCDQETSSKGNPMLVWQWQIVGGNFAGKEIKSYTTMKEGAEFGLKEHLVALGFDPNSVAEPDTDKLIGRKVLLVIGKTMSKNRNTGADMEFNRVDSVRPEPGAKAKSSKTSGAKIQVEEDDSDLPFPL